MGFYSQVQITAEEEAFDFFKEALEDFKDLEYDICNKHGKHVIKFDWVKWYPNFPEVQAIDKARTILSNKNEEGYGYKMIILNEDDTHEEYANERGEEELYDVQVQCYIYNPYEE